MQFSDSSFLYKQKSLIFGGFQGRVSLYLSMVKLLNYGPIITWTEKSSFQKILITYFKKVYPIYINYPIYYSNLTLS